MNEDEIANGASIGAFTEPPVIHNQGIFNVMMLPINGDYIAVSHAVTDLLKEGWSFSGIDSVQGEYKIVLSRQWKC